MKRYGSIILAQPARLEEYKRLHADVWPEVLRVIEQANIRNYSIYHRQLDDGQHCLFSYFEYSGGNFAADMAALAAHPVTQRWWALCVPCLIPLASRGPGEIWAGMEELFHQD
jgi:L-rhamnose mutarotase